MGVLRRPIRIVQKTTKNSLQINLPMDGSWKDGDVVRYEVVDEDTIVIKRLRERSG